MLLRDVTREDIEVALEAVNELYDGNIKFKRFDYAGRTRKGGDKYNVTLTVKDSSKAGSRRSREGRRIAAACWHVHGEFMDALPEGAEIVTSTANGRMVKSPGDYWEDYNIGSIMYPMYASDACEC